jgi:hypothetical protein
MRLEGLGQFKKESSDLIENRSRDLPACSITRQLTTLPHDFYVLKIDEHAQNSLPLFVFKHLHTSKIYIISINHLWQHISYLSVKQDVGTVYVIFKHSVAITLDFSFSQR